MAADPKKVKQVVEAETEKVKPMSPPPKKGEVVTVDTGKKSPDGVATV